MEIAYIITIDDWEFIHREHIHKTREWAENHLNEYRYPIRTI